MRLLLSAVVLVALGAASPGQEKGDNEKAKVEVALAAQHVPEGLKAGSRADLLMVLSTIVAPSGLTSMRTAPLAAAAEVLSVKREEKPADPLKAVVVELRVTKEQAAKIEKIKTHLVTVVERKDGKIHKTKRPVLLRLELAKPAKE